MSVSNPIFLSVVLGVYNNEKDLGEAIGSVLSQTYPYFELIVVNDGSTDNSEKVIKRFVDSRVIYISKPNTGLADTLNVGIRHSRYDWIVRMDGDDICMPDRFETLVSAITDDIDIIGSNAEYFNDKGSLGISKMPLTFSEIETSIKKGRPSFIHPTVMIRKSLLDKVGGYDANFVRAQDHNLWIRSLSYTHGMINIDKPLLRYRYYPKPTKSNYNGIMGGMMDTCIYHAGINHPLSKEDYMRLRKIIERSISFKISFRLSNYLYKPILKYAYPIWCRLGFSGWQLRRISKTIQISDK